MTNLSAPISIGGRKASEDTESTVSTVSSYNGSEVSTTDFYDSDTSFQSDNQSFTGTEHSFSLSPEKTAAKADTVVKGKKVLGKGIDSPEMKVSLLSPAKEDTPLVGKKESNSGWGLACIAAKRIAKAAGEVLNTPVAKGLGVAVTTASAATAGLFLGTTSLPFLGAMAGVGFTFQHAVGHPEHKEQPREPDIEEGGIASTPQSEDEERSSFNPIGDEEQGGIGKLAYSAQEIKDMEEQAKIAAMVNPPGDIEEAGVGALPEERSSCLVKAWEKCVQKPVHYLEEKWRYPVHLGIYIVWANYPEPGVILGSVLSGMWGEVVLENLIKKVKEGKITVLHNEPVISPEEQTTWEKVKHLIKKHPGFVVSGVAATGGLVALSVPAVAGSVASATSTTALTFLKQFLIMGACRPLGGMASNGLRRLVQWTARNGHPTAASVISKVGFPLENPGMIAAASGFVYALSSSEAVQMFGASMIGVSQGIDKEVNFKNQDIVASLKRKAAIASQEPEEAPLTLRDRISKYAHPKTAALIAASIAYDMFWIDPSQLGPMIFLQSSGLALYYTRKLLRDRLVASEFDPNSKMNIVAEKVISASQRLQFDMYSIFPFFMAISSDWIGAGYLAHTLAVDRDQVNSREETPIKSGFGRI